MSASKCVIGVGSPHGDDQIGWLIADDLETRGVSELVVHKVSSPLEILDWIDGVEWLGICDACRGEGPAGSWHCWTWPNDRIIQQEFAGTHDIGLTAALELAVRLGRLPATVMIWGVEVGTCQPGDVVSLPAKEAVPDVAGAILDELIFLNQGERGALAP